MMKKFLIIALIAVSTTLFAKGDEIKGELEINPDIFSYNEVKTTKTGAAAGTAKETDVMKPDNQIELRAKLRGEIKDLFDYRLEIVSTEDEEEYESSFEIWRKQNDTEFRLFSYLEFENGLPKIDRSKFVVVQTVEDFAASVTLNLEGNKVEADTEMDKGTYIRYYFGENSYAGIYPFYSKFVVGQDTKIRRDNIGNYFERRFETAKDYYYKKYEKKNNVYDLDSNGIYENDVISAGDVNGSGAIDKDDVKDKYIRDYTLYSALSEDGELYPYFEGVFQINEALRIKAGIKAGSEKKIYNGSESDSIRPFGAGRIEVNFKNEDTKADIEAFIITESSDINGNRAEYTGLGVWGKAEKEFKVGNNRKLKYEGEVTASYDKARNPNVLETEDLMIETGNKLFFRLNKHDAPYIALKSAYIKMDDKNDFWLDSKNGKIEGIEFSPGAGYKKYFDSVTADLYIFINRGDGENSKAGTKIELTGMEAGMKIKYIFE